jgi:hypothetical protein
VIVPASWRERELLFVESYEASACSSSSGSQPFHEKTVG